MNILADIYGSYSFPLFEIRFTEAVCTVIWYAAELRNFRHVQEKLQQRFGKPLLDQVARKRLRCYSRRAPNFQGRRYQIRRGQQTLPWIRPSALRQIIWFNHLVSESTTCSICEVKSLINEDVVVIETVAQGFQNRNDRHSGLYNRISKASKSAQQCREGQSS
jgi:hypothetical protein